MRIGYLILTVMMISACSGHGDWRSASRDSAGLAPSVDEYDGAVIQVYAADAWGWRGWFAVHTWLATKRAGDIEYTVHDVVGWRQRWSDSVVRSQLDIPDRYWFGSKPELLLEIRGDRAEDLIDEVEQAIRNYPWKHQYSVFPGPNSNTFVAWISRQVPDLQLELPFAAIGSSYAWSGYTGETDSLTD